MSSKKHSNLLVNTSLSEEDIQQLSNILIELPEASQEIEVYYIKSDKALNFIISNSLKNKTQLSVDLEFDDNRYSYGRTISLIQVFDGASIFLIDGILIENLKPLYDILEADNIEKIFHSCSSDLSILSDVAQCFTKNIHDTSLIFSLLLESKDNISLSRLLEQKLDVKLKKEAQASNWVKRPLSESQLNYAAYDVAYLPALKEIIEIELGKTDRKDWYEQDRKALEKIRHEAKDPAKRLARKHKLNSFKTLLLKTYWDIADDLAQKLDKPNYRIIDSKQIVSLVESPPSSRQDWINLKGCHPRLKRQPYLSRLINAKAYTEKLYRENKEKESLSKQLPNAMKWRSYKKHDILLNDRGNLFDQLRELMAEKKGINLQTLVMPSRIKSNMMWEGLSYLTPWRQEVIEALAKENNIDIESIRFSLVSNP